MNKVESSALLNELKGHEGLNSNLSVPRLVEKILERGEAELSETGAVCAKTGKYTGRSPKDKFIVKDDITENTVDWGDVNQPIDSASFDKLYNKVIDYLKQKNEIFLFKGFAGADKNYRLPIQVFNEYAWHNLFASQLFIRPTAEELASHEAGFTIVSAPTFKANPEEDGTKSETFIIVNFTKRIVLIGGTEYAGEMKKSIFSVMNYMLPQQDVLSMHCSANVGQEGDVALFFGDRKSVV